MLKRLLLPLGYLYLLRVPLLVWLFVLFMFFGSLSGAAGEPILRGIFDVASFTPSGWRIAIKFAEVTLAALLAGSAIWFTSRIILANGFDRFKIERLPITLGIEFLVRFLPLVAVVLVLGRVCSFPGPALKEGGWGKLIGPVLGFALWYGFNRLVQWLTDPITTYINNDPPKWWRKTFGRVYQRQVFVALQWLISVLAYFLYLVLSLKFHFNPPTLSLVFLLLTLICLSFAGLSYFLDRYRIPLLLIVIVWGSVTGKFPQGDHFYEVFEHKGSGESVSGSQILQGYAGLSPVYTQDQSAAEVEKNCGQERKKPIVLVATTGGGIQASAWTARVLTGLTKQIGGFDCRVAMVSSVSGGSVGAMFFVDAYENGAIPDKIKNMQLDLSTIVTRAEDSSLDEVTWGLAYPDLGLGLFPFLKGIGTRKDGSWHWVDGGLIFTDRGLTLEDSWNVNDRQPAGSGPQEAGSVRLSDWRKDVSLHKRPAVIFNSTLAETGQRFLLSTTDIDPPQGTDRPSDRTTGRVAFFDCYKDADLKVRTAARLSATFPYVSPATRMLRNANQSLRLPECPSSAAGLYDGQPHAVDGGYYDNYGMATLLDWLDAGAGKIKHQQEKASTKAPLPKILIVEIRASPSKTESRDPHSFGFFFQSLHPLEALWNVSETGQLSHNALDENLVKRLYPQEICSVIFEFKNVDETGCPKAKPLNWHLTPDDIEALRKAWESDAANNKQKEKAQKFLEEGECQTDAQ